MASLEKYPPHEFIFNHEKQRFGENEADNYGDKEMKHPFEQRANIHLGRLQCLDY